jgi:hypothetical protein
MIHHMSGKTSRFHAKHASPWVSNICVCTSFGNEPTPGILGLAGGRTGSTAPPVPGLASVSRQGRVAGTIQPMKCAAGMPGSDLITLLRRQKADQIILPATPWHRPRRSTGTDVGFISLLWSEIINVRYFPRANFKAKNVVSCGGA